MVMQKMELQQDLENTIKQVRTTKENFVEIIERLTALNIKVERIIKHENLKKDIPYVCDRKCNRGY